MKGQLFLEILDGRMASQGIIQGEVGRGFFRVRFFLSPNITRILPAEALQNFLFFDSREDAEAWIKEHAVQEEAPATVDDEFDHDGPEHPFAS